MTYKKEIFSYFSIKRLCIKLVEKYCPFNIKIFQITIAVITTFLMVIVLVLGWVSLRKVKDVVTEDFNGQQLVLAQHAARQIENNLNMLKKEIFLLTLSPSIQYFERSWLAKRMYIAFSSTKEEGVLEIRYVIARSTKTYILNAQGYHVVHTYPEDYKYLEWAGKSINRNNIFLSDVHPIIYGNNYQSLIMKMALPVRQVSVDETNPVATGKLSGVLIFVVDTTTLTAKVLKGIRSGKSGYSWIIDEKGMFLYHPEKEFIGKNAFEVRKEKKPSISFVRINEIQKKMMLTGKEGTSWYISGWHKGKEGVIKKLIAYTPVKLSNNNLKRIWSIAVVAPISEVEEAIHSIQIRQFMFQATIIAIILFGGLSMVFLILNWSTTMEQEVEKKTIEFKKSEQRYKSLVENAEDIIFTVDKDGNYLSINSSGARFFKMNQDSIIGRNMSEILLPSSAEAPLAAIKEVFETKKGKQITHLIKTGDQEYWFNTNFRRLFDEEGSIYAVLGISRDITDRRNIEDHSYHMEKLAALGTLAAGVAHEINNPLGIILGFTDLLLEKTSKDSQDYDMLLTIEKHGLRAKRVVQNLLSFARYTEHKEELVDINKAITSVISVVNNTFLIHKINLVSMYQENLPFVKGFAEEIEQVIFNIINNAIYVMKNGGTLSISTRTINSESQEFVEIRISDSGPGIKIEHRGKIFDPLFTTKKTGEGTGLGLSVCYGIIMKHGGTITFETRTANEAEETGTTFIITLPAVKEEKKNGQFMNYQ